MGTGTVRPDFGDNTGREASVEEVEEVEVEEEVEEEMEEVEEVEERSEDCTGGGVARRREGEFV